MPIPVKWSTRTVAICLASAVFTAPVPALSGAWTLAEDEGQLIVTSGRKTAPAGALFGGVADRDKSSLYVFVEYGLTDRLTLGASGSAEYVATTNQVERNEQHVPVDECEVLFTHVLPHHVEAVDDGKVLRPVVLQL